LKEPYDLKKPSKIFVCSVADLFAPWTPIEWTNEVFKSMYDCPIEHQWQLLTKNPERIPKHPFPMNWWIGATVTEESEQWKIDVIRDVGCGVRFISFEPLLGKMQPNLKDIDWVIIGKLTGSKKIKLQQDWVTSILAECDFQNVPVFLKNNLGYGKLTQEFPKEVCGES
jgi:protein gp37